MVDGYVDAISIDVKKEINNELEQIKEQLKQNQSVKNKTKVIKNKSVSAKSSSIGPTRVTITIIKADNNSFIKYLFIRKIFQVRINTLFQFTVESDMIF